MVVNKPSNHDTVSVLYEKLDQMTQEALNPDLEDECRQELKAKITAVTLKLQTND